jgi:hypothetical protein
MELHALRLSLSEQDLNDLLRKYMPKNVDVEDLRVRLDDHCVHVSGIYPFFFPVRFETIWEIGVDNGHASARLASFKAMGVPGIQERRGQGCRGSRETGKLDSHRRRSLSGRSRARLFEVRGAGAFAPEIDPHPVGPFDAGGGTLIRRLFLAVAFEKTVTL